MASKAGDLARQSFLFRFSSKKPRDIQLAAWIAEDTETGQVNVSEVIKDLLYAWYCQRLETGVFPPATVAGYLPENGHRQQRFGQNQYREEGEDPNDPLVQSLLGLSFENV